jgi:hypothetical protein
LDAFLVPAGADGGKGATGSLEDEADGVGWDEEPVEPLRLEARDLGGEVLDTIIYLAADSPSSP